MSLTVSLHKKYKSLAYLITQKAKKQGKMKKWDYENIIRPYATILRIKQLTEKQLLSGLRNAKIEIIK